MPESSKRAARRSAATMDAAPGAQPDDVRVGMIGVIPALLRESHCDPDKVMASVGLDPALFDEPNAWISFTRGTALLEACAVASGIPHFGLLVGARFDLSMLGVLGQLMINSDSVRTALGHLIQHLHLHDRGAVGFMIDLDGDETALGYSIFRSDVPGISQIYGIAMAHACGIMRSLCGLSWNPGRVTFSHGIPPDAAPYRRFFRAPLHFDAARSEVIFASHWLDRPLAGVSPSLRMAAERMALILENDGDNCLAEQVQRAVHRLLMTGDVSSPRICAQLGIHERVLRRLLLAQGTSLNKLIGASRYESACQLLGHTQLSLAEIASSLGYSDTTAFSRAFRKWAKTSPSEWQNRARAATLRHP